MPIFAPLATVKSPVRLEAAMEHPCELKRLIGFELRKQLVPTQLLPVALTGVPGGADVGANTSVGAARTVNVAEPKSPVMPVTVTVKVPLATPATTKEPDIEPPPMLHVGPAEIRPGGTEDNVQGPVSPALKPELVAKTLVPGRPIVGNNASPAVLVNVAVPKSVPGIPVTVTMLGPLGAAARTVNEPVTTPPAIAQAKAPTAGPAIVQVASPGLKPVPETPTTRPAGPELGVRVTTRGIIPNVATAEIAAPTSVAVMT